MAEACDLCDGVRRRTEPAGPHKRREALSCLPSSHCHYFSSCPAWTRDGSWAGLPDTGGSDFRINNARKACSSRIGPPGLWQLTIERIAQESFGPACARPVIPAKRNGGFSSWWRSNTSEQKTHPISSQRRGWTLATCNSQRADACWGCQRSRSHSFGWSHSWSATWKKSQHRGDGGTIGAVGCTTHHIYLQAYHWHPTASLSPERVGVGGHTRSTS